MILSERRNCSSGRSLPVLDPGRATFDFDLAPNGRQSLFVSVLCEDGNKPRKGALSDCLPGAAAGNSAQGNRHRDG